MQKLSVLGQRSYASSACRRVEILISQWHICSTMITWWYKPAKYNFTLHSYLKWFMSALFCQTMAYSNSGHTWFRPQAILFQFHCFYCYQQHVYTDTVLLVTILFSELRGTNMWYKLNHIPRLSSLRRGRQRQGYILITPTRMRRNQSRSHETRIEKMAILYLVDSQLYIF